MVRKRVMAVLLAVGAVSAGVGCGGSDSGTDDQAVKLEGLQAKVERLESQNRVLRLRNARLRLQLKRGEDQITEVPTVPPDGGPTVSFESFQTPSKNIACSLSGGSARCDIRSKTWDPGPKPDDCPVDWGGGLTVGGTGPGRILCAGDTVANPSAPILGYGERSRVGGFECVSEQSGMTCTNTSTGHGFTLSKESKKTF